MRTKSALNTLFICFLLFYSCNNRDLKNQHVLIPGVGIDSIQIGKSTVQDIIRQYGENFNIDTFYFQPPFTNEILSLAYIYKNLGISFFFWPNQNVVSSISVYFPCSLKSYKGIELNKTTFIEIEAIFGKTEWHFVGTDLLQLTYIQKMYDGIIFRKRVGSDFSLFDSLSSKYDLEKIDEIGIEAPSQK